MNRSKKPVSKGGSARTRLMCRALDVAGIPHQIPRKATAARSRAGVSMKRKLPQKLQKETQSCEIRRDSKKQLNVSGSGEFYEKAKSRRIRQKTALEQSGNQDAAVALGKRRLSSTKSLEVGELEKQFEHKSYFRRASITHGLKRKQQQKEQQQQEIESARNTKVKRRQAQAWKQSKTSNPVLLKSQPRPESHHAATKKIQPTTKWQEIEKDNPSRFSNQSEPFSHRKVDPKVQLKTPALKIPAHAPTQTRRISCSQKQKDARHQRQGRQQKIVPDESKSSFVIKAESPPVVIDLLSDSESESDENDVILELTMLLQNEAIGRGANRKEMKVYAQHLFRLGLHSKEMILDALDFNSNDLTEASANSAAPTNTDMASEIVNRWEWMKPFHKTVFYRWVWFQQQQRQR